MAALTRPTEASNEVADQATTGTRARAEGATTASPSGLLVLVDGLHIHRTVAAGLVLAFGGGGVLSAFHLGSHGTSTLNPWLHYLRDAALAVPSTVLAVAVATIVAVFVQRRLDVAPDRVAGRAVWAVCAGVAYGVAVVPGSLVHGGLFEETIDRTTQPSLVQVALADGMAVITPAILMSILFALIWGTAAAISSGRPVWTRSAGS